MLVLCTHAHSHTHLHYTPPHSHSPPIPPLLPSPAQTLTAFDPFAEEVMDIIRNKKEAPHARVCMMEFVATALSDVSQYVSIPVCLTVSLSVYLLVSQYIIVSVSLCVSQSVSQSVITGNIVLHLSRMIYCIWSISLNKY